MRAGRQNDIVVVGKLQAFQHLPGLEGLQFMTYRVLLTPDQVRTYESRSLR